MVKFRGIDISIISQFDIRKLPEFELPRQSTHPPTSVSRPSPSAIASCYVPIYPGSQIWFEYCIDGPHPPGAAYFFKLFLDGKVITSWDCTEKHDYHGKMMYNLSLERNDFSGEKNVVRHALRFGSDLDEVDTDGEGAKDKNMIELRVHRVEHRKRIRNFEEDLQHMKVVSNLGDGIQLCNSGLLEHGLPCRRYQYQLLDPIDEPYATFRFYYRSYDFLEKHGIVGNERCSASSPLPWSPTSEQFSMHESRADDDEGCNKANPEDDRPISVVEVASSVPSLGDLTDSTIEQGHLEFSQTFSTASLSAYLPPSDSEGSLNIVTKDSIEDLPSTVPRSPKSSNFSSDVQTVKETLKIEDCRPSSPPPSPRRKLKKKLTVNTNGVDFNLDRKKRPLSPFTGGGMLRKLTGGAPPSVPAAVTDFVPTIEEEKDKVGLRSASLPRATRPERGGQRLMAFLGRRTGTA